MRKAAVWTGVVVLILSAAAMAANQYGIADQRQVTLYDSTRVGDTLLPAGDYKVVHEMQGSDHVMVFSKISGKKAEARVKCTLVPLTAKATRNEIEYKISANKEQVLTRMVFKGDRAEHRF